MTDKIDFDSQFLMDFEDYFKGIDLSNWFRYYVILKEVFAASPKNILEIGVGNEVVKNCLKRFVQNYKVLDINSKLKPDILSDIREYKPELKEKFDCVICADVLEHMPFSDLSKNLENIFNYLSYGGTAIIAIPHRRARIMIITPISYQESFIMELPSWMKSSPKSFYRQVIKRQVWKDPYHCWEIGDGIVKRVDVDEVIKKTGFEISKFKKLLQVDFWILIKK